MATKKKTTGKKQATKRKASRKRTTKKNVWESLWPVLLGAVIVVVSCYFLFRALFSPSAGSEQTLPKGYTVHGIDVSHHQGTINWELLRNQAVIDGQPISFAFIKATEGSSMVDTRFKHNFEAARKYGIMRGAYHFYRANAPAKQQAEFFIRQVQLCAGDLPPVLDVEMKPDEVSIEDFRQGILEWLLRVEQHYGVKPILYTYHSFRRQYMNDSIFNLFPYWIAHYYVDTLRYHGRWTFWQHSDRGNLPGIRQKVDLNVFNGTFDELHQLGIQNP